MECDHKVMPEVPEPLRSYWQGAIGFSSQKNAGKEVDHEVVQLQPQSSRSRQQSPFCSGR